MAGVSEYFDGSVATKSNECSMMSEYQNNEGNNIAKPMEMQNNANQNYNLMNIEENAFEMLSLSHFLPTRPNENSYLMGDRDDYVEKNTSSFYSSDELNRQTVSLSPRMGKIPSQYQLESLTEVYFFDIPRLLPSTIPVKKSSVVDDSMHHSATVLNDEHSEGLVQHPGQGDLALLPCTVHSQYINQLLY